MRRELFGCEHIASLIRDSSFAASYAFHRELERAVSPVLCTFDFLCFLGLINYNLCVSVSFVKVRVLRELLSKGEDILRFLEPEKLC